jgi:archaea-specific RecJ-like exonuclease
MKHKKKNFSKKPFQKKPFKQFVQASEAKLDEITMEQVGNQFVVKAVIDSVAQTSGPTLFTITDGTATLVLKGFEAPGERAYPDVKEGDSIEAKIQVNEYNGMLEGEIKSIFKLTGEKATAVQTQIKQVEKDRAKAKEVPFLIKSPILDKLKDKFLEAATQIRLAVIQNRPIIVRHHNDADGYSSGFALERAILPLIEKQHGPGKAAWEFYLRAPCAAPFYEIDDSIRDTSTSLRNEAKFSNKMPLIIIADNGSSQEDLMAIKQGKIHGIDFIVIDHHFFEKDVITSEVLVHINPFLIGENGSAFSAGMLCTEIARFINTDVENIEQIPAMAGLADRIDLENPKAVNDYLKIAENEGYTKNLLNDISTVIDFVSAKLRFMEAREYIEVLFGEPRNKQKELVKLLAPYIRDLDAKGLEIAKSAAKVEKIGKVTLQTILIEENFPGFGFFPKPGRATGLLHDHLKETKKVSSLVTAGILNSAITIRATDEANFSVHNLIEFLNKKIPEAFIEGGGHKNAGSITFIPSKKDKVVSLLKEFIKSPQ